MVNILFISLFSGREIFQKHSIIKLLNYTKEFTTTKPSMLFLLDDISQISFACARDEKILCLTGIRTQNLRMKYRDATTP